MLYRLILLGILAGAVYFGITWWRRRKLLRGGSFNILELKELFKAAKSSPRMEAALKLRTQIIDDAENADSPELSKRMDDAIRKLARQEELRGQIEDTLKLVAGKELDAQIDEAKKAGEEATDEAERISYEEQAKQLEIQKEQLDRLRKRRKELDNAADRIIVELQNLRLAILDVSSSEAALSSPPVQAVLGHLEEASEDLRLQAAAEDEVNKLLRSAVHKQQSAKP